MLASAGPLPTGPGWAYELKWDGVRVLADVRDGALRLTGRRGTDCTPAYPELAGLGRAAEDVLLDGEVVALVDGRPSFAALQSRMHVRGAAAAARLAATTPVTYFAFDVLRLYGVDLTSRTYAERRATLERLAGEDAAWCVPPVFDDGPATVAASRAQGLEGVVAKRLDATYRPGLRTHAWVKVKHVHRQEFVVGGWQPGDGGRAGDVGSLLLGVHDERGLVFVGQAGSGISGAALATLRTALAPLLRDTSPFATEVPRDQARTAVWCEPVLVAEVSYGEWTPDGRLRFPVYRGLRDDVDPTTVVRE